MVFLLGDMLIFGGIKKHKNWNWLVVSTHLKNNSQNGHLPQIGVNIKNIWNHHLGKLQPSRTPAASTYDFFSHVDDPHRALSMPAAGIVLCLEMI